MLRTVNNRFLACTNSCKSNLLSTLPCYEGNTTNIYIFTLCLSKLTVDKIGNSVSLKQCLHKTNTVDKTDYNISW